MKKLNPRINVMNSSKMLSRYLEQFEMQYLFNIHLTHIKCDWNVHINLHAIRIAAEF